MMGVKERLAQSYAERSLAVGDLSKATLRELEQCTVGPPLVHL
eukprot:COSAG01_NODE_22818_length_840_cov_0.654521_2_plen_43_part_00